LLEAGAEVHHASNHGWTALTAAAFHGHVEALRGLYASI
jgi:ankyrin repeat protein